MRSSDLWRIGSPTYELSKRGLIFLTVVAGTMVFLSIFVLVGALMLGNWAFVASVCGFAGMWITACMFRWSFLPSTTVGESVRRCVDRSTVRQNKWTLVLLCTAVVSVVIMATGFAVAVGGYVYHALGVGTLFVVGFLFPVATGATRNGWVSLSHEGIRFRGWSCEAEVPWSGVVAVSLPPANDPKVFISVNTDMLHRRNTTNFVWQLESLNTAPTIGLDCRRFDVHPMVLAQWIRFYIDGPAARVELGTEAAAERLVNIRP